MQTSGELTQRGHFPLDWQGPGSRDLVRGWDISSRARFNFASAALHTRAGTRGRKPAALTVPASLGRSRRNNETSAPRVSYASPAHQVSAPI